MKKQDHVAKDQYKLLRELKDNVIHGNRKDDDNREQDKSGESNNTETFHAILVDIRNNGKTTNSISVKSRGSNINLHPPIMKLLNKEETIL